MPTKKMSRTWPKRRAVGAPTANEVLQTSHVVLKAAKTAIPIADDCAEIRKAFLKDLTEVRIENVLFRLRPGPNGTIVARCDWPLPIYNVQAVEYG